MKINKIIRQLMIEKNISLLDMAVALGKKRGNDISARLATENMTISKSIEMLDILGYDLIVQPKENYKSGQIIVDQKDSEKTSNPITTPSGKIRLTITENGDEHE